jgi:adenine C2-methylase RlmN of 23S rRNA A2503 and tRNA A37
MDEKESYSIFYIKEAEPQLEKHRKDVLEKYLEYEYVLLKSFNDQGKTLDDVIEQMKTILWFVKNERIQHISNEFGL